MANIFLFKDNATASLAAPALTAATTMTVAAGQGARFPSPGANEQFTFSLFDAATGLIAEIVYCTSRTVDVLTVVRGQEGTAARDWDAGTPCFHGPTAGTMTALAQTAAINGRGTSYWAAAGTANALTITPTPVFDAYFTGMSFAIGIASNNTTAATLNVNGLGTKAIVDQGGVALTADMLVAGRVMQVAYTAAGSFRLVTTQPALTFITSLPVRSPLDPTDLMVVSDGTVNYKATLQQLTDLIERENFADAFFLGMG
jgi:hypothetical protein